MRCAFGTFFFFFFTLVIGPRRSLSLKLSDMRVYEPQIRARLGTITHFAAERGGNYFNFLKDFRTEIGSRQGPNLSGTGFFVPSLLDS